MRAPEDLHSLHEPPRYSPPRREPPFCDTEAAKRVLRKVEEEEALLVGAEQLMVGFTDRGGKDNVPLLASGLLTLSRLARKLKSVLVVVDAEECTADDRVRSLSDSLALKERGLGIQLKRFRKDGV